MKIDFIIISGILVIICFLPFILFPLLRSREEKSLQKKFKEEASALSLNMSFFLRWNSNLAGIDILKKHFLFIQKTENDFAIHHIDLNKVSQIKMTPYFVEIRAHKKIEEILSRIDLEFFESYSATPVMVTIFDKDLNYSQDLEIKNAQKLVTELQKYLKVQPVLKRSA